MNCKALNSYLNFIQKRTLFINNIERKIKRFNFQFQILKILIITCKFNILKRKILNKNLLKEKDFYLKFFNSNLFEDNKIVKQNNN
jgi:hypothetical protein